MATIILTAPMQGWITALDAVSDAVFAERMLGDGVAIDPVGDCLHAPCDGVVVNLQATGHAITLATLEGAEILMHIGLDTVALGGRGFTPCVAMGDNVKQGDPLIRFDLDLLVQEARAVITPIVVTNPERFAIVSRVQDRLTAIGDVMLTLEPREQAAEPVTTQGADTARRVIVVPMAHGIHARPAARIGDAAKAFAADVTITKGDRTASVRSPIALLSLGAKLGDDITVSASGDDAAAAVTAIADLILGGMGERAPATAPSPASTPRIAAPLRDGGLAGVTASPGLAIGTAYSFRLTEITVERQGRGIAEEQARLAEAIAVVAARLADKARTATGAERSILDAHAAMLDDPALASAARASIKRGDSAGHAWRSAIGPQADALRSSGDARLAERADDMLDLERQVLAVLAGVEDAMLSVPPGTILLAEDLLPSHLLGLNMANVAGFCVERGGPTSHVAILAATMGIPALVAVGPALRDIADGATLILDAGDAVLQTTPDADALASARAAVAAAAERKAAALARAGERCVMRDGTRIEAFANLGSIADARVAMQNGAEGCGLLRTEFLFLERDVAPTIAEQLADYQAIARTLEGQPLIIRLLDIGGDKPAPYLPIPVEENPALGLRGIRVGLAYPDILDDQLRAILSVRPLDQCRIMVPMIASLDELRAVRAALDRIRAEMGHTAPVSLGVMIETPAAAITADLLASEADFLSIGTNDLTQYTLAMDRGNAAVAAAIDGLHPAVLRLIGETCLGGARHGRWTGVCGGLASDPLAVPILIGLGVTELSAAPAMVPDIKALVAMLTMEACRAHATAALDCRSAAEVRALAREFSA